MIQTSVILLSYNGYSLTMARLAELASKLPYTAELIWVDNGSRDVTPTDMQWWMEHYPHPLKALHLEQNVGFGPGHNQGAALAQGENLLFLSNDVQVLKPFVADVAAWLKENPRTIYGGRLIDFPGGWNEVKAGGKHYTIPYLEGWFLGLRSEVWKELGGFDPNFAPADMEDVDLSMNALQHQMELVALPPGYFHHLGGKSFEANHISAEMRMQQTIKNKAYFDQKWTPILAGPNGG